MFSSQNSCFPFLVLFRCVCRWIYLAFVKWTKKKVNRNTRDVFKLMECIMFITRWYRICFVLLFRYRACEMRYFARFVAHIKSMGMQTTNTHKKTLFPHRGKRGDGVGEERKHNFHKSWHRLLSICWIVFRNKFLCIFNKYLQCKERMHDAPRKRFSFKLRHLNNWVLKLLFLKKTANS